MTVTGRGVPAGGTLTKEPGLGDRRPLPVRAGHRLLIGLLLVAVLLPLVPLLIWSMSGQWRYPALLPQQLSLRGLQQLVDPRSEILQGMGTSAVIGTAVAALACLIASRRAGRSGCIGFAAAASCSSCCSLRSSCPGWR